MQKNPFTPNFGQVPMYMAGREQIIQEVMRALDEDAGSPARTSIMIGARGTGKTALLSYFAAEAQKVGWLSANVSCVSGMREDILEQAVLAAEEHLPAQKKRALKSISLGNLIGVEWENKEQREGNWRTRITRLLMELEKADVGLLITVDEVTAKLDEMIQLASVHQHLMREKRKLALLMAGLPTEVSSLLNDRSVSFLRRANQYYMTRLEDHDTRNAFRKTVEGSGKRISEEALNAAVAAIDGFPYMIQLVGFRAWEESGNSKQIQTPAVTRGIALAKQDFETRVLRATVQELSQGDTAFLRAMLPDDKISEIADIEQRMKKNSGYVSRYRARLVERGVITAAGRGRVEFALPGLREYLAREE